MGGGTWTKSSFTAYSTSKGMDVSLDGAIDCAYSAQEMFKSRWIAPELNPRNVMRECCDSEEHPNTIPVILALDVTGSMNQAAVEVAKKLNVIMTELYSRIKDIEFLVMGIGDLAYDGAPIQASQFESDIRIAEQLDKVYFENGGGGNNFESYTAAWYFGARHTKLDCWNRGQKGIIITMGDETLNPYLPYKALSRATGDTLQADIETSSLYKEVTEKFDVYHLNVQHGNLNWLQSEIQRTFKIYFDDKHFRNVNLNNITNEIIDIIVGSAQTEATSQVAINSNGEISW